MITVAVLVALWVWLRQSRPPTSHGRMSDTWLRDHFERDGKEWR